MGLQILNGHQEAKIFVDSCVMSGETNKVNIREVFPIEFLG